MEEIWQKIKYDDNYSISNLGRVRNDIRGNFLKNNPANNGYIYCILRNGKKVAVHRLVAEHFVSGNFTGACVDHIDGNKTNNRADNLQWLSIGRNVRKKYIGKLVGTNIKTGERIVFETQTDAGNYLGCGQGQIGNHLAGRAKRIYNWKFNYEQRT